MSPFEEVPHTADWALHAWAPDLPTLFVDAAKGMYALAGAEGLQSDPSSWDSRSVEPQAEDFEALLVGWLQELLYYTESEGWVFFDFRIDQLEPTRLAGRARGAPATRLEKPIKAVTYNDLDVRKTPNGYEATIVFDV